MKRLISVLTIILAAASLTVVAVQRAESSKQVEWPYYGGDQGGMKYSPLTDINPENVQRLQIAWQWKHWDAPLEQYDTIAGPFESTPLMIDGVLYVTTPYNNIAAARCRDRQGVVAVRWRRLQARAAVVGQRLEAARHRVLARRQQAAHLPQQPPSAVLL